MFESIWEDLKRQFQGGDTLIRLVLINLGVFVAVHLIALLLTPFFGIGNDGSIDLLLDWLAVPSDPMTLLTRPWTIFTYMFLHVGFWHILWNLLFLYWFGRIVQDLLGDHRILPIYVLGGLAGFLAFFISANFFPESFSRYIGGRMLGASAGVTAVVLAAASTAPTYRMHLILIGPVQIRYIALFFIFLDLISIRQGSNTGGHLAHLGGGFLGWYFVHQLRSGQDWGQTFHRLLDGLLAFFRRLFGRERARPRVVYKNPRRFGRRGRKAPPDDQDYQEKLDAILDKIKDSGYESLTKEEKEFLFNASKK
ncbi:MAG: rhomboid family intramembrane serine protease [Bacteroidetes bacterium]|nr:MAG: rhomboid family intramembrane serine protease [Bacteroidota bacterium]